MNKFFKRLALVLVIVMALVMIPVSLAAADPLPADADPAVWDTISLTRADGTSLVEGTDYTVTKGKYSHYAYSEPFTYNIYNVTTSDPIVISGGAAYKNSSLTYPLKSRITLGADVTRVTLKDVTALGELSVTEGSNVYFTLAGENYVDKILGTGLSTTITFGGEGSLTGEHIGGVDKYGAVPATNVGCNIVISSGTFNITAGYKSAIGGGQYGNSGKITINGGNITAKSNYGAAIGGGQNGSATEIVITDGEINATGSFGAAIGGGQRGGAENISISGGTIEAKGSHVGAAIGGGQDGDVGKVEITDGDITVIARSIGIGGQDAKNISISGGNIELKKLNSSSQEIPADAGMIGAANGSTDAVEISGGSFNVELPEDYLAEGTEIKKNEDGTYGVKAASVAKIGTVEYATLDAAIAAAQKCEVIVVNAGEYKLNGNLTYTGKAFTIKAADGAKVSFDMSNAVALHGATITFDGVTFDYKTNDNYIGIQHADTLEYNSCTIKGQVFLYATNETFNGCTFNQTSADAYNVWTYGAKNVEFNRCVFNCVGRCVLLYNEGANTGTDLTVTDTTFKASAPVAGKAAIEIDTSLMRGGSKVTVDKATADKTTGFDKGSNSGNSLWNDKKQTAETNKNTTVIVNGETVFEPAIIDLDTFIKKLVASGYNFDGTLKNGGKLTVKWSPVSGCYDTRAGHTCTVNGVKATGNTPKRVNSGLTQFQLFEGSNVAVTIKNVKFVYEPAAFTVCENSGWKGSYTAEQAPAGQLYFMTTGDVTVDSCDFEKVVFTTFNTTGTSTVKDCTFKNIYNNYAIKDIRGGKVSVTGTTIENCGGGIMVSSTGTVSKVTITGNTFNNVDTAGTAPEGKVGTRAILQIASSGDYASTAFDFSGNTATSCGPVIRQLNKSVAPVGSSLKYLTKSPNSASGLYTSDSKVTYVAEVTFTDGTTKKYSDIAEALEAANAGDTVTLLADINTPEKTYEITKSLTIDLNGKTVTGSGYDGVFEVTGKNIEVFLNATNGGKVIAVENSGSDGKYAMAVWMCGAGSTLTINGGEFIQNITSTNDKQMDMIYASAGTIIINSGSFTSGTPKWTLNIKDSAYKNSTANIIVNGGTFTDYDPRNAENEGKGTSLVADGVGIDKNADGTFTAKSGMAAQIVDADGNSVAAYATLADAIAAANAGDTVKLLADVTLDAAVKVPAGMNVTLDLNGKKLSTTTKTGDATRHYYAIDNYGKFTLRDSSAKQSGEIRARGIENLGTGTMTIESGKIVAIDANGGAAIWNNANLTINGGTFVAEHVGASSDQYGPGCVYNNGTLTINGGTFTSANKRTYAIVSKAGTVTITPADGKNVTISGAHGGLGIDGGTAIINGGSYASSDYYGLYVSNDAGTADVTVNGGTFTGKKYSVLIGSDGSSSVTSTLKIKGGTFDMPIHAQENTIDGTIAISGGKFKFKVDDKYFDGDHACSTDTTDGYYTVAGHPIISAGLTISADMSFRVKVRSGYENGSLRYYYDTIGENNTIVRVEGEGILGATDADGNSIFRIYNVNPQRADLVYTFQYYDAEGNAVGTPKQRSVLAYFKDFYNLPLGDNEDLDAKKTFIANFLEYCASAMERSYDLHKDVTLNGKTWQDRANAVREMMTHLGVVATDYEFKGNLGRYYSDNVNGVIIERGVAFGSTFKVYYAFSKATIDNGYRVFRQGMDVTDKLELVDGAYRLYFELAPYEFKDNLTITVNNGTTKVCEYTSPLANTLEVLSKSADASVSKMAKAAFNYFVALQNYNG